MKTDIYLELAKTLGFVGLGYWGFCNFNSWLLALPCGMLGSGIVSMTYHLSKR